MTCEIESEIGLVKIQNNFIQIIIIGDNEPLQMTLIGNEQKDCFVLIKWSYGKSLKEFEGYLDFGKIELLSGWSKITSLAFKTNKYVRLINMF